MQRRKLSRDIYRDEFACECGCGADTVDAELVTMLQAARNHFGKPIYVLSGHRCEKHNASVGGGKNSQHLLGRAADVYIPTVDPEDLYEFFVSRFQRIGVHAYETFVHIDSRGIDARW